ncbi:metallophosphoesterase [Candidatus Woesearchaeota archaeon]|nr:metallophosphoesterase [Candidatus Woesearchaeota archaeon]
MIEFKDLGIFVNDTLIISDLHIGYEAYLNRKGILVPRTMFEKQKKKIIALLKSLKPKLVIFNGDIKHEFGIISSQEWNDTYDLIDMVKRVSKLIFIKGNHDKITEVIAKKKDVDVFDKYIIDDVLICHGDFIPDEVDDKKIKNIIIGHEHPAIFLREDAKAEKYKCFLKTKFKCKNLYVLPSFNLANEGTDVTSERLLSPFLKDAKEFEITITQDGELFNFGNVKRDVI